MFKNPLAVASTLTRELMDGNSNKQLINVNHGNIIVQRSRLGTVAKHVPYGVALGSHQQTASCWMLWCTSACAREATVKEGRRT